ncbi:uncharacterized protein [Clytia hemisphaerica]|uniref:Uncharacterized protein n=1 Tax=Clytia hemisphaerica TaxID=252671 RepID=A0A7M5TXL9_9CNID
MRLALLVLALFQIHQSKCNENKINRIQTAIDAATVIQKGATKNINDFNGDVTALKNSIGNHYWKVRNPALGQIQKDIGTVKSALDTLIKEKLNWKQEKLLKDIVDLADTTTSEHIEANEQKVKDYISNVHEVEGGKLEQLAENAVNKLDELQKKDKEISNLQDNLENLTIEDPEIKKLKETLYLITRQIQNMQFNEEEKTRSDGNSGIKQIRTRNAGGKTYHSSSHTGRSFASIHDHSNNKKICGMGEFIGVLNGVEFRTRHNDYALRSAAHNDKRYEATKELEFPDVPPRVLKKTTVAEQITEMKEWFKAFKNQDYSNRDYRKYFKPILCYLEGAWTRPKDDKGGIDEPFESDRHSIDAKSWFELQNKIRFTSYSGTKDLLENLAWLPTSIFGFDENKKPKLAQWNYRILCHPLSKDLPTSYLKPIMDPHSQKMNGWNDEKFLNTRAIRFNIEGVDRNGKWRDHPQTYNLMDEMMEEIPGKDNYGGNVSASSFDSIAMSANPSKSGQPLNGAYYHRPYKLSKKDAMGTDSTQRGYSDRLYMAMNSQERIAGQTYTDKDGNEVETKVSYAIPMEIIYLTPLAKWNPYDIQYSEDPKATGSGSKGNPYSHSDQRNFFHTPASFFTGVGESDAADTSKTGGVWIKNSTGHTVNTQASGVRIMSPEIADIEGIIRQRYPIMPIYGEGNTIWKRLNAFEDSLDGYVTKVTNDDVYFQMGVSHAETTGDSEKDITEHKHTIQMSLKKFKAMKADPSLRHTVTTTKAVRHSHVLVLYYDTVDEKLKIEECDAKPKGAGDYVCFDKHFTSLTKQN